MSQYGSGSVAFDYEDTRPQYLGILGLPLDTTKTLDKPYTNPKGTQSLR